MRLLILKRRNPSILFSEVRFFHHFKKKSLYIAFEMRYTVLTTGGVQTFLHSIARGIGCFWAMLVATNKQRTYRKQNIMKKTLIALLALGSISQAELTLNATDVYNYAWDTNVTSAAVTLILSADAITALDKNQVLNQVFAAFDITGGSANAGNILPTHFAIENTTYTANNNTTTAFRVSGSGVPNSFSNARYDLFGSQHYSSAAAWDTAKYAALTFGITTSGSYKARAVLSVIDARGTITNITQASASNKIAFTDISGVKIM